MERPNELLSCGCYENACYCGQYPTDAQWQQMEAERQKAYEAEVGAEPMSAEEMDRYPTLAERLAESIKDDRRAD